MGDHAIVIGGSLAGLCAARVLSDFYDRVTIYERDALPDQPDNRTAVPQGRHVHLLMARGAAEFDELFPGLLDDMVAAGVPKLANRPDCIHFGAAGHVLGTNTTLKREFTAYVPSRPHLEWQIRERALAIPNVDLVHASVVELRYLPDEQRVTGVLLDADDPSSAVAEAPSPNPLKIFFTSMPEATAPPMPPAARAPPPANFAAVGLSWSTSTVRSASCRSKTPSCP